MLSGNLGLQSVMDGAHWPYRFCGMLVRRTADYEIWIDGLETRKMNLHASRPLCAAVLAVAAALDSLQMSEIVGCIAGDDTIMAAIRSVDDTVTVMERIRKLIYKE